MKTHFVLMKAAPMALNEEGDKPPNEVKSPNNAGQTLSISSLAKRLHSSLAPQGATSLKKRDSEESRFFSGVRRARTSDLYDVNVTL